MKSITDINKIISDPKYREATANIAKAINLAVEHDNSPFIKTICEETFQACNCSPDELQQCLHEDFQQLIEFSIKKWNFLEAEGHQQDFSVGAETDEADEVIEGFPLGPAFLIGYLCEFYLLKYKGDAEVTAYMKNRRIPGHQKYGNSLKKILIEIQN